MKKRFEEITKTRQDILTNLLKKSQTISELSKRIGCGRTTIYHHLNKLKQKGLIKEEPTKKTHGNPVIIHFDIPKKARESILKVINYVEDLRRKRKAPSTKEKIIMDTGLNEEDFNLAYHILELYRGIGIVITNEGIKLKKSLKKESKKK